MIAKQIVMRIHMIVVALFFLAHETNTLVCEFRGTRSPNKREQPIESLLGIYTSYQDGVHFHTTLSRDRRIFIYTE